MGKVIVDSAKWTGRRPGFPIFEMSVRCRTFYLHIGRMGFWFDSYGVTLALWPVPPKPMEWAWRWRWTWVLIDKEEADG